MKKLQEQWEKTLFWFMLVALLGTLAFWALHRDEGGSKDSGNKMKTRNSFLGATPYAFLDTVESVRIPSNPFSFGYKPQQNRPWRRPATRRTPNQNTPKTATATTRTPKRPTGKTIEKPPAEPPKKPAPKKPATPPPARIFAYRGFLQGVSGTQMAFVNVTDPATKKRSSVRLEIGRKIDGVEVKDFSGEVLEVVDPKGHALRIPRGKRKKIVLE